VLVCAPLSGHHPTLLRDTVATLLGDHDVYVTGWLDAREVPTAAGEFHLADYVHYIQDFIRLLGERGPIHVVSVCQPTVPVLAAVALLASAGEATPQTLTLMGGPIDARVNPTVVNKLATERPLAWFRSNMIHRVPGGYPGAGREVYPGFLQLTAFVMMNPQRHTEAYRSYWVDQLRGNPTAPHEKFYDEYNAVLDMDAAYYLETVATVFQDFSLPRGTWVVDGAAVRPADITTTALFTIEGETDDISGLGQTEAAHGLCTGIPAARHRHHVAPQCGHYGLFSGNRWRTAIYPELRGFIAAHHPTKDAS
jgi:poly(3-hydroxybutyrate) depolymerase